jgi:hypothetical protein
MNPYFQLLLFTSKTANCYEPFDTQYKLLTRSSQKGSELLNYRFM